MKPDDIAPEEVRFHRVLDELYRMPDTSPGSIDTETGRFIHALVRLVRPELAVEVGSHYGISTLWIARALHDNGTGRLLAIDLFEKPTRAEVQNTIERAGLSDRVELVEGPSTTVGVEACRSAGRPIDFLYLDGGHRVEDCAADFETLGSMVRVGGYVILHDIYPHISRWDGPRYVLNFIAESRTESARWEILEVPTAPRTPFGLAVLRKVQEGRTKILPRPAYWLYQWNVRLKSRLQGRQKSRRKET